MTNESELSNFGGVGSEMADGEADENEDEHVSHRVTSVVAFVKENKKIWE